MHIVQKNILTSIFEIQLKITFLNHDIQSNYLNIANTAIAVYENWLSKAYVSNTLVRSAVQSAENIPFNKKKSHFGKFIDSDCLHAFIPKIL